MSVLPVHFERRLVGVIDIKSDGPGFVYDPDWLMTKGAFPISLRMPLRSERIGPADFVSWAANLLPESEQLRAVGQYLGTSTSDIVGILTEIGRDTAGALSIGRPGSVSTDDWRPVKSKADLERILDELPNKPFLIGEEGISMSLAGVQSKLAVAVTPQDKICIPVNGTPSTHILKPDSTRLWGGVQNEAYCLTLAGLVGVHVPRLTTGKAGKRSYLLIERYDRREMAGRWRRLHQEDMCQALGIPPSAKYEANNTGTRGPGVRDLFEVARKHLRVNDVPRLLDMIVMNVLVCNTDAHAKNYSIIISARDATLAPAYDIMCADVWPKVTKNLAQKIAGKNRGEHLKGRHWQRMARECGLNPRATLRRIEALAKAILGNTEEAERIVAGMPAGSHPLLPEIRKYVECRARSILNGLDELEAAATLVEEPEEIAESSMKP